MKKRVATVNSLDINGVAFSAILSIGDTKVATPTSRALALQKKDAIFSVQEDLSFWDYHIFNREAVWISPTVQVEMETTDHTNTINVNHISIIGVSESSITQIGSIETVNAEARIKHIRRI